MQEYQLTKTKGDRQGISRSLWEEIFPEDTKQFLDYYYRYKASEAWVYLLRDRERVIAMLHLNPYQVSCHGEIKTAYYIVGVATKKEYRHKGCMSRLLRAAISDAAAEGCLFLFLMPVDPAIYEPFGFRYGYWHQSFKPAGLLSESRISEALQCSNPAGMPLADTEYTIRCVRSCKNAVEQSGEPEQAFAENREREAEPEDTALAGFAMRELNRRYRTFCVHDAAYFARLRKELESENGALFSVYKQNENGQTLMGYFCYAKEETAVFQEVVLPDDAEKLFCPAQKKAAIMFLPLNGKQVEAPCYFPEIV